MATAHEMAQFGLIILPNLFKLEYYKMGALVQKISDQPSVNLRAAF